MNNLNKIVIILMASLIVLFAASAPTPPVIPEVRAVSSNEEIILMWDNNAESSIDPFTGYSDFEGYRIYRSNDGGQTWGKSWNRIYDYLGNHVAWEPFAQFDLIEESDSLHCIYSNGYLGESGELCYSNAIPYNSLPERLYNKENVIIDLVDSLVYLPNYVRGNCPIGQDHISHSSSFTHETDCYGGGNIASFDPMASWISLGDNDSLKRSFVDMEILDGVEYTYAVTAFDIGMQSFNIEFLSTASENSNDICLIEDYGVFDDEEKALLEIESFCESLPSCIWIGNKCQYSDENYCSDNDSYCTGMECCGADGCCKNDVDGIVNLNKDNCNLLSGYNNHIWLPDTYLNQSSCEGEGFIWQDIDHGYEDYSIKQNCEDFDHEWVVVEYYDEETCEEVDLDGDGISDHQWTIIHFEPDTTWSSWNPGHFTGLEYGDDLWGYPSFESPKLYESFTDYNVNGICDNEPFTDEDSSDTNANGICDEVGDWSSRCPNNVNACKNAVVVESGYKASNITFPADTPEIDFIAIDSTKDSRNRGNGSRVYKIVNEYELTDAVLRFEINAGLDPKSFGDSTGSFATLNPSLYIYEIISKKNMNPKDTIDILIGDIDSDSLITLLDLPGARDYSNNGFVSVPDYKIEDFALTYVDDPLYANHFTDWFDGIQFRFDNGPNKKSEGLQFVELKNITFSDTFLKENLSIKMKYNAPIDIAKRPMYRYRVDLNTSLLDADAATYGTGRVCHQYAGYPNSSHSLLPLSIENITNGKPVSISHMDNGIQSGSEAYNEVSGGCTEACTASQICINKNCVDRIGNDDCSWQRNEIFQLKDIVFIGDHIDECNNSLDLDECLGFGQTVTEFSESYFVPYCGWDSALNQCHYFGEEHILFDLKIDFNFFRYALSHEPDYFGEVFSTTGWDWRSDRTYGASDMVYWKGMLYRSKEMVSDGIEPNYWFDTNGDNINDNVWEMLYPWKDGDYIIIEPYGWYQDGDAWVADLSIIGELDDNDGDDLESVSVVPNPYIVNSDYFNESPGNHLMRFTRLPTACTISIYTVSGEFVTRLDHDDSFSGNEWWDITNGRGQEVAPGLYIYVVETPGGKSKMGKFAIVR